MRALHADWTERVRRLDNRPRADAAVWALLDGDDYWTDPDKLRFGCGC